MKRNEVLLKLSILENQILFIVGVIFRHFTWMLLTLIAVTQTKLSENISKKQKSTFLLVDFNVNLLNYNEHNPTNAFLDSLASFVPLILQSTRVAIHSNTLKDNKFSNIVDPYIMSGNVTATISDHLPQFGIIPNMFWQYCK